MSHKKAPEKHPYEEGDIVHIRPNKEESTLSHRFACKIIDVCLVSTGSSNKDSYEYMLYSIGQDRKLDRLYTHDELLKSPRGYPNINRLLGSKTRQGERLLGKFKRTDLEHINEWLTVVDFENDPTKDWLRELQKEDTDRINSVVAELILLYHLRVTYGQDQVKLNAHIDGEGSKDFDIRVSTHDEDVWIEVVKPDYAAQLSGGVGFISGERSGNAIDRKLRGKFRIARERLPQDAVLILGVYLEEKLTQGLHIHQWLDEEYYDVGDFCDGWLTYTHLAETDLEYYPLTDDGERCADVFKNMSHQ